MEVNVKQATSKELILVYKLGYTKVWVISSVAFFLASLLYWFVFQPANESAWVLQGALLKKETDARGVEALFRMPNHETQQNIYIPLDEPFIRHDEDRKRYELILKGRTSEKRQISRIYEKRIATYPTKEAARKHYREILDFLHGDGTTELKALSKNEHTTTLVEKSLPYLPFILATLISLYFLMFSMVKSELRMNRSTNKLILSRNTLLIPLRTQFPLQKFERADLTKVENGESSIYRILLHMQGQKPLTFCEYKPPYKDDKYIASLSQHTHMINWWNDDELIEKYGDTFLKS